MREYDVAIIGAGPAGSTTALAIKRKLPGLSVLLVDKSAFPRDKVCGDGIGPGSYEVAKQLGIADNVFDGQQRITQCVLHGPGEIRTAMPMINGKQSDGYVVRRTVFDERLRQAAVNAGVDFLAPARFVSCDSVGDRRDCVLEADPGPIEVSTRLLIGADGANSRVRKALGEERNDDTAVAIAIRSYVDVLDGPDSYQRCIFFGFTEQLMPGYGWLFPLSDGTANVGVGIEMTKFKSENCDLKLMLNDFVTSLPSWGFQLGETSNVATYTLPDGRHLPKLSHQRAILLGDAASMINPLTGEGIFYGMASASMLADCLSESLSQNELQHFERSFRRRFEPHYRSNDLIMRSLTNWTNVKRVFSVLSTDKGAIADAVNIMFGDGRLSKWRATKVVAKTAIRKLFPARLPRH